MEHDDPVHVYRCVEAAVVRYIRLGEETRSVPAVDYSRVQVDHVNADHAQDIWLEKLDERAELQVVIDATRDEFARRGMQRHWEVWWSVTANEDLQVQAAKRAGVSTKTVARWIASLRRKMHEVLRAALVERGMIEGKWGRDLLYAGSDFDKGTKLWVNPDAHKETP